MKQIKIFILEDNGERVLEFYRFFFRDYLVICNNAEIAINILKETKFDLIFLDHDLDNKVFVKSEEPNTGFQVSKALVNTANKSTDVVIHSHNDKGAAKMMKVLELNKHQGKVTYLPFGTFNEQIDLIKGEKNENDVKRV